MLNRQTNPIRSKEAIRRTLKKGKSNAAPLKLAVKGLQTVWAPGLRISSGGVIG